MPKESQECPPRKRTLIIIKVFNDLQSQGDSHPGRFAWNIHLVAIGSFLKN
jgi:hypothetical protein